MGTRLSIFMFFLISNHVLFAGGGDKGGGDVIICSNPDRIYNYDYFATHPNIHPPTDKQQAEQQADDEFKELSTCNQYLEKISQRLEMMAPIMSAGLKKFIDLKRTNDLDGKNNFQGSNLNPLELANLSDELVIKHKIPDSCAKKDESGKVLTNPKNGNPLPNLRQAIIRRGMYYNKDGMTIDPSYSVDHKLISKLASPLQCSYMYIHEWLRDFMLDSDLIAEANAFLHSQVFMNKDKSDQQFSKKWNLLFLDIGNKAKTCLEENLKQASPLDGTIETFLAHYHKIIINYRPESMEESNSKNFSSILNNVDSVINRSLEGDIKSAKEEFVNLYTKQVPSEGNNWGKAPLLDVKLEDKEFFLKAMTHSAKVLDNFSLKKNLSDVAPQLQLRYKSICQKVYEASESYFNDKNQQKDFFNQMKLFQDTPEDICTLYKDFKF